MSGAHHHDHAHGSHGHHHGPVLAAPPISLLRMSMIGRLAWAVGAIALIWAGVFWAMV